MIPELRVEGADQLKRVNAALRHAQPSLRRELSTAVRDSTEPLKRQAAANIPSYLPSSGGLAGLVAADTKLVTQRRGGRTSPGVRIAARSRRNVRRMDRTGTVRHPLFGNRDHWFTTRFRPGWFSNPMQDGVPGVRRELIAAMSRVAAKIVRSA